MGVSGVLPLPGYEYPTNMGSAALRHLEVLHHHLIATCSLQLSVTSVLRASLWSHLVVLVHYSLSIENCIDENLPAV